MKKPEHLKNVAGIVAGFLCIVLGSMFTLWQLDIIVSGPVWHVNLDGSGWAWHNGAYAAAPFQCFLWRTTIGAAYDTLFLLNWLVTLAGGVLIFLSLWYWTE